MGLLLRSRLLLLVLMLLVPAALVSAECNDSPCVGQPDCTDCDPSAKVSDPENCRGYYVCINGNPSSLPFECADGEVFNATSRECEEGDSCEPCPRSCSYECPEGEAGYISSFTDCHTYYECDATGGIVGSFTCDESTGPFFDGATCQTNETLCCHCHAFCNAEDVDKLIPDPVDCRGYYLCTNDDEGQVPTMSGTCSEGNFDSILQSCSATAPCTTDAACRNVLGPDGCIDPFTCETEGSFAKCPEQCTSEYYHCEEATGEYNDDVVTCPTGTVFHPDSHICVAPDDCPYT